MSLHRAHCIERQTSGCFDFTFNHYVMNNKKCRCQLLLCNSDYSKFLFKVVSNLLVNSERSRYSVSSGVLFIAARPIVLEFWGGERGRQKLSHARPA